MNRLQRALIKAYNDGYRVIDGIAYKPNGEPLQGTPDRYGYINIKPNPDTPVYVHRLLAYQKYGNIIFENGVQVRHKNNIKTDNSDDNILIGDQSRNMMDRPKDMRRRIAGDANRIHPHVEIIEFYNECRSYKQTMERFNLTSKGTLSYILNKSMAVE